MKGRRLISDLFLLPTCRQNFLICSHNLYYTSKYQKSILEINEHTFYNYFRVKFKGGIAVDEKEWYKEKIIEKIDHCDNLHWLKTIYAYLKGLLK